MSKKSLVDNILYGKDKKADFTDILLPRTRRKQFAYLMKHNYLRLFYLNLITFLFFCPLILYYLISNLYIAEEIAKLSNDEFLLRLLPISIFQHIPLTVFLMIGFVGLSGTIFVIRKMTFDEVINLKYDFLKGMKYSYKQFMMIGFICGLILFLYNYASQYLLLAKMDPLLRIFLLVLVMLFFIILLIAVMYMLNLSNLYVMNTFMLMKSSLLLAVKELFKNLGVLLITFVPIFIWLIFPQIFLKVTTVFLLSLFGFSYILLSFTELSMYSFDRYINQQNYPDFYRKGLGCNG